MEQHIKILAYLNIGLGGLGLLMALVILIVMGGVAGIVAADGDSDAEAVGPFLGLIGGVGFMIVAVLSAPSLIAGIGLLKYSPWAQPLMIVVSVLNLIHIPVGTAVGVYGLWVLFQDETKALIKART